MIRETMIKRHLKYLIKRLPYLKEPFLELDRLRAELTMVPSNEHSIENKPEVHGEANVLPKKPCHYNRLWIRPNGDLYVCYRWSYPEMRIAHIDDDNILDAIKDFYHDCSCDKFSLRKGLPEENISIQELVIEFALLCQGKCAYCCVDAPSWRGGEYLYFSPVTRIVDLLNPKGVLVQGGEVLIQKGVLKWVEEIKRTHPGIEICLVTNGNVNLDIIDQVERLFNEVKVSIFGFESATYERISGMALDKVVKFSEELAKRKRVKLGLKYVTSPLCFHEANLFLDWAIAQNPSYIFFEDVNTLDYINIHTHDRYWDKISERTAHKIIAVLINNKDKLLASEMRVSFSKKSAEILGLKHDWNNILKDNQLQEKVLIYWSIGETPLKQ